MWLYKFNEKENNIVHTVEQHLAPILHRIVRISSVRTYTHAWSTPAQTEGEKRSELVC